MKSKAFTTLLAICMAGSLLAQETQNAYRNFPIIVMVQFHNLSMPFKDMKSNFSNVGFGLGTELSYNGKSNWVQQVSATWHHNKTVGNGILLYSQAAWRPNIASGVYTELKAGAGYMYAFRPVESFEQKSGTWESVGHKGKGMLTIPLGISLGYQSYSSKTYISPFISYQFMLISGYNQSIPLVPETLIQVGSRIHLGK
ncbi:MAG TPA: hypothetical protein PKJ83_06345 [Cyclobacteriaceae bacterium]|nr:hypothetical protein [Cyclobacteriaceae bacterium]HPW60943.1 hypothetical protein [Cyclobacteriaceae bacterium]